MRGLYGIVDVDFLEKRGVGVMDFARAVLLSRPAALQLRAKGWSPRATVELLRELTVPCERARVPLFANDRPDLAVLAGCAGAHLGQGDLALAQARRVAPTLALGVSTHSLAQVEDALLERPNYVALGPVYRTTSKSDAEAVVSPATLGRASALCRQAGVPLVAIGGVTLARAHHLAAHVDAVAVISALLPESGITSVRSRAEEFAAVWGPTRFAHGRSGPAEIA